MSQSTARRTPKEMKLVRSKKKGPQPISEELEDFDDTDALVMAAMQGNEVAVGVLIESGVDIDHKDSIGVGPIHWAAFCGHSAVIKRLLDSKADLHIRDREGRTPLHVASYERSEGQLEVLSTLIAAGAELHSPDRAGWTPLHCAVSNGVEAAILLLIEAGADPMRKDHEGKTVMDLARHFGKSEMVATIERAQESAEVMALKGLGIGTHRGTSPNPKGSRPSRSSGGSGNSPNSVSSPLPMAVAA